MDRNALCYVQNSANGVVFPGFMKVSLPLSRSYKGVWWAKCYRNHRPLSVFTGWCTLRNLYLSLFFSRLQKGSAFPCCQEGVLGEVADVMCLYLVPERQGWVGAFKYISAQIFPPILGDAAIGFSFGLCPEFESCLPSLSSWPKYFKNLNKWDSGVKILLVNRCWGQLLIWI